uniref:Type-4 uracil-DNA glycosylase n=1 Tax=Caldiarchaeum subterraneum TaxID=311458 RepID=E6N6G3_CALS0|nr:DNA polymerase bacteriophage-type [Candidatus Caldarchaeum subterraneum]BAJ49472.1 DNA polymerase bacteriophage-type [Candidatus Caldarchaeum subterraneum]
MCFVLDAIAEEVRACRLCPLWRGRRNAVPGEGNPRAELMFIGEGPGEEEDLQGRPFVGRSGRLLTEALEKAGIRREDVFITNVVKCRPPENREPTPEERQTCTNKYLFRQIETVNPRLIVLLGSVAVQTLLGISSVTAVRGKAFEKMGRRFFCTYHPAAALYNPGNRENFFSDIKKARELLESLRPFDKQKTLFEV